MNRPILPFLFLLLGLTVSPLVSAQQGIPPGFILVDDMVLPEDVFSGDSGFTANPWPLGVVAYVFNANVSAANQTAAIQAMNEIAAVCGTIFVPRTGHPDWIIFNATTFNSSPVGMQGGGQTINMTSWNSKYIIAHEIMHSLGFIHEQQRPDRDSFVIINTANISTNGCPGSNCGGNGASSCVCNFNMVNGATMATPYDYLSIMHYRRNTFSSNGLDTITCLQTGFQGQIGNRDFMSLGDVQGLQQRYGATLFIPNLNSISPATVTTAGGAFTLHVYGSNFFGGSPNANGVQGTKITWNGTPLPTTFIDSGHVTAQIPASLVSLPQTVQVTVTNPSPAWGPLYNTLPLVVNCQSGSLGLANGVPVTVSNGCQQYGISPVYGAFNVVGVTAPVADWDIQMGTATAAAGGNTCDFVVGTGYAGAGTIQPTTGNVTLYSGTDPATLQHVTSTELLNGQPTIASMPAGSIVRAFHFSAAAVSTRTIQVAGPNYLRWKLMWAGNGFSWRSSATDFSAQGQVGMGPVTGIGIGPAAYCLVVYSDGIPVPTSESLTITMCFDFTPAQLTSHNILTINQGPYSCVPWSLVAPNPRWHVVGISSPSDWDIQIGAVVSQFGGSNCDYVLANGRLGAISPLSGVCSPYSYPGSPGYLQLAFTAALPYNSGTYTEMISAFEFEIVTPGNYNIAITGAPGYSWDLHRPGNSAVWRSASSRNAGPTDANGGAVNGIHLDPGWHCAVVYHNGGPTSLVSPSFSIGFSAAQTPVLSSLAPASATAGGAAFTLSASGSGFSASSVVRWNGADLPTTYGSASQLTASVAASLIASGGTVPVTVFNPGPNGATSAPLTFTINNPAPVLSSIAPASVPAGGPATTLNANGSGFVPGSVVRWLGADLVTTFVSATQLSAQVPASLIALPGTAQISVFAPAPAGGESGYVALAIAPPAIAAIAPASIAVMNPASAPVTVTVTGSGFHAASRVVANGEVLATTFLSPTQLTCVLSPAIPQTRRPGAVALNIENAPAVVSNTLALEVGSGANQGTIRRHPLVPAPGQAYAAVLEGGLPDALFSMYVDLANVPPVTAWPNPTADLVLAVGPFAGSAGPFLPIVEGIGIHAPPSGARLDLNGAFTLPGFVLPSPAFGLDLTVQGIYLDPAASYGFRLTWSRWPDRL